MKILISIEDIMDNGLWEEYCELKGWNVWCVKEGLADSSEKVEIEMEQAKKWGLIDNDN